MKKDFTPEDELLFLALGTYSLKISPKKALRPVHAQKTPTQVKTPVKLDPELIKEAAVAAAGVAHAASGRAQAARVRRASGARALSVKPHCLERSVWHVQQAFPVSCATD